MAIVLTSGAMGIAALHPTRELFKQFLEQSLRPLQPFFRKDHRFHLADGVVDHAFVMQAAEHVPIKAFQALYPSCSVK